MNEYNPRHREVGYLELLALVKEKCERVTLNRPIRDILIARFGTLTLEGLSYRELAIFNTWLDEQKGEN